MTVEHSSHFTAQQLTQALEDLFKLGRVSRWTFAHSLLSVVGASRIRQSFVLAWTRTGDACFLEAVRTMEDEPWWCEVEDELEKMEEERLERIGA